jgi:hypothetical protein
MHKQSGNTHQRVTSQCYQSACYQSVLPVSVLPVSVTSRISASAVRDGVNSDITKRIVIRYLVRCNIVSCRSALFCDRLILNKLINPVSV